jgi:hypothetical protein
MLWECMIISLIAGLGFTLWAFLATIVLGSIGFIVIHLTKEKVDFNKPPKKEKWDGNPIVIEGGKKKDE